MLNPTKANQGHQRNKGSVLRSIRSSATPNVSEPEVISCFVKICANPCQSLPPMNRAESSLIGVNRETSNLALYWPSKAWCSHQAAPCLGLLRLSRLRLCGGRRRPPLRLPNCHPTQFLDAADAARPHPFRQSQAHAVCPSTPAKIRWSVVLRSHAPMPIMLQVVAPYVA